MDISNACKSNITQRMDTWAGQRRSRSGDREMATMVLIQGGPKKFTHPVLYRVAQKYIIQGEWKVDLDQSDDNATHSIINQAFHKLLYYELSICIDSTKANFGRSIGRRRICRNVRARRKDSRRDVSARENKLEFNGEQNAFLGAHGVCVRIFRPRKHSPLNDASLATKWLQQRVQKCCWKVMTA